MSFSSSRPHRRSALAGAASLLSIALAAPAFAQATPAAAVEEPEIVVTATKRETSLLEVPFSINAQTEAMIERSGANTLEDLSRNVAGLTIQNLGPGQSQVSVRGVSAGQIVRDQPGVKEQVGVYLDESVTSLSLFTPDLDLYDLNRVETLRGPQGTLFGSGSVGGTIRYITNQPEPGRLEGSVEGNINTAAGGDWGGHIKGAVNVPFGDQAALRAVAYHTVYPGFVDARREGDGFTENINDGHRTGGRIAFRFESGGLTITPRVLYQKIVARGFNRQEVYNLYANPYTTVAGGRPPIQLGERQQHLLLREHFSDRTYLADLNVAYDFGPVVLTGIASYIHRDIEVSRDASALTHSVSIDLGYAPGATTIPSNLVDTTDLDSFTQELRLSSDGEGPLQWVLGAFHSKTDRFYRQRLPTPGYDTFTDARFGAGTAAATTRAGFPPNSPYAADLPYDIRQTAVFGEGTFDFTDRFSVTAGGRYYWFEEERRFTSSGLFSNLDNRTDRTTSDGFSPRIIATYEVLDNVRLNAQASKGFRLGGVNDPLNLPLCSPGDAALFGGFQNYGDETLWNYELGVRGQRRNLSFAAAAFYTDIHNLQVTLDAGTCSSRIVFNVDKAHTMGLEAELTARPVQGLDLSLSGSIVEAEFDSTLPGALAATTGIREGNRLPTVPRFQISASASYSFPVGDDANGYVGASFQHVGSRYTQPSDQENNPRTFVHGLPFGGAPAGASTTIDLRLPAYNYVNLSAGIDWDSGYGVMLYVTNLFDETALLSFDRERGGRARLGFNIGQPRIIGLTVRRRFGGSAN
ncbi:MAG TPA: TonB-dependent receptor [Allosphingosinicella sp.]|nr:TonB-dependent receptor [Allosphingosinicella sp.]